jgi:hypothetical protein
MLFFIAFGNWKLEFLPGDLSSVSRAPQWHQWRRDFLKLPQLGLTCSTLGKSRKTDYLTYAQIIRKNFYRWIKQWIKWSGGVCWFLCAPALRPRALQVFASGFAEVLFETSSRIFRSLLSTDFVKCTQLSAGQCPCPASQDRARIVFACRDNDAATRPLYRLRFLHTFTKSARAKINAASI